MFYFVCLVDFDVIGGSEHCLIYCCLFDLDVIGDTVLKASPLKIQEEPMEKGYITLMLT